MPTICWTLPNLKGEETELREVEELAAGSAEGNGERKTGHRSASLYSEPHQTTCSEIPS